VFLDKLTGDCTDAESIRDAVVLQTAAPETARPETAAQAGAVPAPLTSHG
jgi:hypothetical protein